MIYVGYVIRVDEAVRLLKFDFTLVKSFYDTAAIESYLKEQKSKLTFLYIDKGAGLLGISLDDYRGASSPYSTVKDTVFLLEGAQKLFLAEVKRLGIDTSLVNLTWIEEEEHPVKDPEPYVISI